MSGREGTTRSLDDTPIHSQEVEILIENKEIFCLIFSILFCVREYLKVGNKHPKKIPNHLKILEKLKLFSFSLLGHLAHTKRVRIFAPLHLREAVPDNVIQDEAEQEDRVPVRPPGPALLAVRLCWLDVLC